LYNQAIDILAPGKPALHRAQGHDDDVILIRAHRRLPLWFEKADHVAGELLDANLGPHRILPAKQLVAHGLTDHAHCLAGTLLCCGEVAAVGQHPVARLEVIVVAAADHSGPVLRLIDSGGGFRDDGRDQASGGDLVTDGIDVSALEVGHSLGAGAESLARHHHQQVAPHASNLG
jgi:hypothetical protein